MRETWHPILDDMLAKVARATIHEIAIALLANNGLSHRASERALFYAYARELEERFAEPLEQALLEAVAEIPEISTLSLWSGLAGTGFAIAHINDQDDAADVLETIDDRLRSAHETWDDTYDLIGGLVGHAVYFLERLDSQRADFARHALDRIVELLAASAEATPDGMTWLTPPTLLPPWQRDVAPAGHYNCGVAHGVPGIIAVLGRIAALPDPPSRAGVLCDEATRWLLAQRRDKPAARFPAWLTGDGAAPARLAWCYGDPGVATALAASRRATSFERARELATEVAACAPEHRGTADLGLCHGPAGLAHLMNRWFQASRDPVFRDAARGWFELLLARRRTDGLAGFVTLTGAERTPTPTTNLLEGAIGIGLALIAALSASEPAWDRMFLCDIPPSRT
jgi:hypothetical protein